MPTPRETLTDWAERVYAAPEVAALCLTLQDDDGQSVCLLLWAAWVGGRGHAIDPYAGAALARAWETDVIGPLRAARRGLKTAAGLAETDRAALRARVRADELAAERALLAALEAMAPGDGDASSAFAAMTAASLAWGLAPPAETLSKLAAAFPQG